MPTPTPEEIADNIATSGTTPAQVTVDGLTVRDRSVDEKIKAHEFAAKQTASASSPVGAIRFFRIKQGGASE